MSSNKSLDQRLVALGFSSFFQTSLLALGDASLTPARVSEEHRGAYRVLCADGELTATATGRLRHEASGREELPAVGDWVAVTARPAERAATIRHVLPRRGALVRKVAGTRTDAQVVAANLDTVFVVTSANEDFNAARIARYLTAAWDSGGEPVVLLAKCDLCEDVATLVGAAEAASPGVEVHAVSAVDGRGFDGLSRHLVPGRTVAIVGSSGVGKSTLINRLLGEERLTVKAIREHDGTGVHTTTSRQLLALPSGALVVDTPGMRELGLMDGDDGLSAAFSDVEELASACRFRDCIHKTEPGCAVRAAVLDGSLPAERVEQWEALRREMAFIRRKTDMRARIEESRRLRRFGRVVREITKARKNRPGAR